MTQFDRAHTIVTRLRRIDAADEFETLLINDAADEIERLIEVVQTLSEHYEV